MTSINIAVPHLLAASYFAGKRDIRPYLNGVRIEISQAATIVVATDGTALAVCRSAGQAGAVAFTVPTADVVDILKRAKDRGFVTFSRVGDGRWACNEVGLQFTQVEGTYPEWRRLLRPVSGEDEGKAADFQPELLTRVEKAAKALGSKHGYFSLHQNGGNAAFAHIPAVPEFVAVVMPRRPAALSDGTRVTLDSQGTVLARWSEI